MITGERRSGTTLIANFLNAQEGISIFRDFLHIARLQKALGGVSMRKPLTIEERRHLIRSFREWTSMLEFQVDLDPTEFITLLDFYLNTLFRIAEPGDRIIGHKTTMAHRILRDLLPSVPELKVVYCLRDPRDVVASALKKFADEDAVLFDYITSWQDSYQTLKRLFLSRDFSSRIMILRYEDFILHNEDSVAEMSEFLDVKLEKDVSMTDYGKSWRHNSAFGKLDGTFDSSPIGRWKKQNPEAGKFVEAVLHREMTEAGYRPALDLSQEEKLRMIGEFESYQLSKLGVQSQPIHALNPV
jgi:hypothetical protein